MTIAKLYTGASAPIRQRVGQPGDLYVQISDGAFVRLWVCIEGTLWQ